MRRTTVALTLAFTTALIAAVTAGFAWWLRPSPRFAPLSLPDALYLVNGTDGPPPQIASGQPLTFNRQAVCNNAGQALVAHASLTIISDAQPAQASEAVLASVPVAIETGCDNTYPLSIVPASPLPPGLWHLALTITTDGDGQTQTISTVSRPFMITGGP